MPSSRPSRPDLTEPFWTKPAWTKPALTEADILSPENLADALDNLFRERVELHGG